MLHIDVDGVAVPALGLGTWPMKGDACRDAVAHALSSGYRHVDTAAAYANEEAVGEGIRRSSVPRSDLFLTTKVWYTDLAPAALAASADASLRRLGVDHVDLLLIHWPSPSHPLDDSLDALDRLRRDGKTRLVGVSNFPLRLLRQAIGRLGSGIACNQMEYHPFLSQAPLRQAMAANGGFLTAYSPLVKGAVVENPVLRAIAAERGRTPAQIVLRWFLQQDRVAAVPKAASPDRQRENFDVFGFRLDAGEMARIDGLACGRRTIDPSWAPDWDAA
jgi:diketogulonate reductase-like aldo/keto reductase